MKFFWKVYCSQGDLVLYEYFTFHAIESYIRSCKIYIQSQFNLVRYICSNIYTIALRIQVKEKLKKFLEAMMTKSGKIRSLIREIKDSYTNSDMMTRQQCIFDPCHMSTYFQAFGPCMPQ